jgi:hypothetical protein
MNAKSTVVVDKGAIHLRPLNRTTTTSRSKSSQERGGQALEFNGKYRSLL